MSDLDEAMDQLLEGKMSRLSYELVAEDEIAVKVKSLWKPGSPVFTVRIKRSSEPTAVQERVNSVLKERKRRA